MYRHVLDPYPAVLSGNVLCNFRTRSDQVTIHIDIIHRPYSDFPVIHALMCMYVCVCVHVLVQFCVINCVTYVVLCNHHHKQGTELFHHHEVPCATMYPSHIGPPSSYHPFVLYL